MGDVVKFPSKDEEPLDSAVMCEIKVYGDGRVTLWMGDYIEDVSQHNWLVAKIAAAQASIIERKLEKA